MKIIHTADWHLGKNIEGHSRLPEQKQFLDDFVKICDKEKPDLILIAGDIYDSYNPPALAEQYFYDTLKRLSRNGECMTVIISGNHDNPDRLTASGPLARDHGIVMAGTPGTVIPTGRYGPGSITQSGPGYILADLKGEKLDILLVPFPSEKRLNEVYLEETADEATKAERYEKRIQALFSELSTHYRPDACHLIIGHLFVMNSLSDGSERSISLGGSYIIGGEVFPGNTDYIALGHIHKPQQVPGLPNARYSGAPVHYNQREIHFANQLLAVEITNPIAEKKPEPSDTMSGSMNRVIEREVSIRDIPLPVYKPIELWKCESTAAAIEKCRVHSGEDSWVFLEIETTQYIHEEDIKEMKKWKSDILSIRPVMKEIDDKTGYSPHQVKDLPFETIVQDFYRKKFQMEMEQETLDLLMEILGKEEEA